MKKIVFVLFSMSVIHLNLTAQVISNNESENATITPFNSAISTLNGENTTELLLQPEWKHFQQKYPTWGTTFDKYTQLPHRALGTPITYTAGTDAVSKAIAFIQNELSEYHIPINELQLTRNYNDGKYINVDFKQVHHNMEVLFTRVTVRFTQDLKIILFGTDVYRNIPSLVPTINQATAIHLAEQALTGTIVSSTVNPSLKLFPLPVDGSIQVTPVYEITVNTMDAENNPGEYQTYVNAIDGKIVYRTNQVKHFDFKVKANLYPTNLYAPAQDLPLPYIKSTISGTDYFANANGVVTLPSTGPVTPDIRLEGLYSKIVTGAAATTSTASPLTTPTITVSGDSVLFPVLTDATIRHFTAYYHVNLIHDFMKSKFPAFTVMDNPLLTRVDRTDGTCNAFYNGTSINFYTTASGCNAFSQISDVMYHEYGHGISDKFWTAMGGSFDNGAMGEGYSDVWAMCLTHNPIIGPGYSIGAPASYIRRYDMAPKVYPVDIVGEVHADGEIIAGAWWDTGVNWSSVDSMGDLFAKSQFGLATGPDGTEGKVYFDILIDALTYDDDDANLANGTPHFAYIVNAFAKHGIYLLYDATFSHNPPSVINSGVSTNIDATATVSYPMFLGDAKMLYRLKGTTTINNLSMTKSGMNFSVPFPSTTGGEVYDYIFELYDNLGNRNGTWPIQSDFAITSLQRNIPFTLAIGYKQVWFQGFDTCATNSPIGWTVGNAPGDNATAGKWIIKSPIPSYLTPSTATGMVQTGTDHTPTSDNICAVTGNAASATNTAGNADVDGGSTSLITNTIDITGIVQPIISYWRWYSNSQSANNPRKDFWRVQVSYDNGGTWATYAERTYQPDVSWRRNLIILNNSAGNLVKLKFVAQDSVSGGSGGTLVEAAVDDLELLELGNTPNGINDIAQLQNSIYPNPVSDKLYIKSSNSNTIKVELISTTGALICSKQFEKNSGFIDVKNISNGIYYLKMWDGVKSTNYKVIVSK